MFLYFIVSVVPGSCCLVHQPPVVTAALGYDVIMPCQINLSHNETFQKTPVLYWDFISQDAQKDKLWKPSGKYKGRVQLLDKNPNALDKSVLLQKVQWADNGKYNCKVTFNKDGDTSLRRRGNDTLLAIYDTMTFNLTAHNDSLLHCEINVTLETGFVLSIVHNGSDVDNGWKLQSVNPAPGGPAGPLPYVTLSETASLRDSGNYECQLHLNKELILKRIFHHSLPGTPECPEPWLLYSTLLLAQVTILLGVVTAMLCRR